MGKVIYLLILIFLTVWVYRDAKMNFRNGILWATGVFVVGWLFFPPILFSLYFWTHPPYLFWDCPKCKRRNFRNRRQCPKCQTFFTESDVQQRLYGFWDFSDAIAILLIALLVSRFIMEFYIGKSVGQSDVPREQLIDSVDASAWWLAGLISSNVTIGLCLYCVTGRYRLPLATLGLTTQNLIRNIFWAFLLAGALILAEQFIINLFTFIGKTIGVERIGHLIQQETQVQQKNFPTSVTDPLLILTIFIVTILVPVSEEMLFRGLAYVALRNRFGKAVGMLLNALLFAMLHGLIFHFLPIFLIGLGLAFIYEKTRSLIPCIIAHTLINLVAIIVRVM